MKLDLAITGVGMLSAVGLTAAQSMHSVRSAVSRLALEPLQDRARQWIAAGRIPLWSRHARMRHLQAMCDLALAQAWQAATADAPFGPAPRLGLILGAPDAGRPGYAFPERSALQDWAKGQGLGRFLHLEVMPAGASSTQMALHRAEQLLQADAVDAVLVGAADTQVQFRVVRWHEDHMRLKCSYVNDGLMPSEAAAILVVESARAARARGARAFAHVLSVAAASDDATVLSDQPNTGRALTAAVGAALADAGVRAADIGMVWSDLNGESFRAREWAYCEIRNRFDNGTALMHPADCYGDVGAATDASLIGLASWCHATRWSAERACLVVSSSEGGVRAATVLAPGHDLPWRKVSRALPRCHALPDVRADAPPAAPPDPLRAHFEWQLHEEHRDELAALHYQRQALLAADEVPWARVRDPEQRMLDHLDAILSDGAPAVEVALQGASSDEEGLCFAAAFVAGAHARDAVFEPLLQALSQPLPARVAGIGHGLAHAPRSEALQRFVQGLAAHPAALVRAMAVDVAGLQQIDFGAAWDGLLADPDDGVAASAALACRHLAPGRLRALERLAMHRVPRVRRLALLALLALEPDRTRVFCLKWLPLDRQFDGALSTCLGIRGQLADAAALMQYLRQDPKHVPTILALGMLGASTTIEPLLALLASAVEPVRTAARDALALVVGMPAPSDDPGEDLRRLLALASDVAARQAGPSRLRRGQPHSALSCWQEIEDATAKSAERQRAALELRLGGAETVPYDTRWFVARQQRAIAQCRPAAC